MKLDLSIVIPCGPEDQGLLEDLLFSIRHQTLPASKYEVIVVREGNSEEAKAIGIRKAHGQYVMLLCSDNYLVDDHFLETMLWAAKTQNTTGAYTLHYTYVPTDKPLSRYFALLGANDPLCWFLGKADRKPYWIKEDYLPHVVMLKDPIPSVGDNGFLIKRDTLMKVQPRPETFFPMDVVEDLRRIGFARYTVVPMTSVWHRTGESVWLYFRKRFRYTKNLYFAQLHKRRWNMVKSTRDWVMTALFDLFSFLVLPQFLVSLYGFYKRRDWAWFLHAPVSFVLTFIYGVAWINHIISRPRSSSPLLVGENASIAA